MKPGHPQRRPGGRKSGPGPRVRPGAVRRSRPRSRSRAAASSAGPAQQRKRAKRARSEPSQRKRSDRWALGGVSAARRTGLSEAGVVQRLDGGVLLTTSLLAALGIVMIYSSTAPLAIGSPLPPHWLRHLAVLATGMLAIAIVLRVPLAVWRRLAMPLWVLSLLLLGATLAFGLDVNGARRWLPLPGLELRFQPAELARFATLLAVAALLAGRGPSWAGLKGALALSLPPAYLLLKQPDFGSAALLLGTLAALLFAVGLPVLKLGLVCTAGLLGAVAYVAFHSYALARWTGFLDPWATASNEGFQLVQSFIAFGRGGSLGVGLGDGRQKLFYLPEAHTDFMLSVVAEELGLVGVLVVLGAFAALALAGVRIALRARDPFVMLVAFGASVFLTLPAAVNAAVVMGLLPTTGFPLPFVSYGSNSLLFCALATGLLLRIAAHEAPLPAARVGPATPRLRGRS